MSGETILVVDDEPDIRQVVQDILEDEDYAVVTADSATQAENVVAQNVVDLVLLDIWMPGTDGITLLKQWKQDEGAAEVPVIMISGHGNVETAVEAVRYGAYDFLEKPLSSAKLLVTVDRALQNERLRKENVRLRGRVEPASELIGKSAVMRQLRDQVARVADTEGWVLITGEPGCGKGVVARCIHRLSRRSDGPFVEMNIGAIPRQNLAAQLFGSERDGVVQKGRFELAKRGTLVLDGIADADLETQGKLVSSLEEEKFVRIGGEKPVDMDLRILATTNQDLQKLVAENKFREDLYYRLNVLPITVPPLRDHLEDVPELVEYYLDWMVSKEQLPYRRFGTEAVNVLRQYRWPGNVRELKNLIQRLLILNLGEQVSVDEVKGSLGIGAGNSGGTQSATALYDLPLREARDQFERDYLQHHLRLVGGNMSDLAQSVGMERTHLYRKVKGLGIDSKIKKGE